MLWSCPDYAELCIVGATPQRDWCLEALDRTSDPLTGSKQHAWRQRTDEWRYAEYDDEDHFGHPESPPAL